MLWIRRLEYAIFVKKDISLRDPSVSDLLEPASVIQVQQLVRNVIVVIGCLTIKNHVKLSLTALIQQILRANQMKLSVRPVLIDGD